MLGSYPWELRCVWGRWCMERSAGTTFTVSSRHTRQFNNILYTVHDSWVYLCKRIYLIKASICLSINETTKLKRNFIKKLERSYTTKWTAHLKVLEKKEANTLKKSRQQEIIKLRAEIDQLESKRNTQKKSTKLTAGFLRKSTR